MSRAYKIAALALTAAGCVASGAQAQVPTGSYECYFFTSPRPGLNFTITGNGRYTDVEGAAGTFSLSGARITFRGAALDGQRGDYKGGNPPTVSLLGPRGDEVSICQRAR